MTNALQPYWQALPVQTGFAIQRGVRAALLVTNVVDDSSSICAYGNTEAIQRGFNEGLDNFEADADGTRQILVSTLLINKGWLYLGQTPADAARLDNTNYNPNGDTPLFPATEAALDFVSQAADYLTQQGLDVYSMTHILTDGADTTGRLPSSVRHIVDRMQETDLHIVAGIAVRDGTTDFFQVFKQMGIREQWIKVIERKDGDIATGVADAAQTVLHTRTVNRDEWKRSTVYGFHSDPDSET